MTDSAESSTLEGELVERRPDGTFQKGKSGNPLGRPKGSKNAITLIKQSLELALREQAAPELGEVLAVAIEKAKAGDNQMIKLLLEMHVSKGTSDEVKGGEKVAIQINAMPTQDKKVVNIIDETDTQEQSNGKHEEPDV